VGRLLDVLLEPGVKRDTLVVFTSDHGDMLGAHGMIGKVRIYCAASGFSIGIFQSI